MNPVLYFPVKTAPLQMEAGFSPLGSDLGGEASDHICFLSDNERDRYLQNKRRVPESRHWVTWSMDDEPLHSLHCDALMGLIEHLDRSKVEIPLKPLSGWREEYGRYRRTPSPRQLERLQDSGETLYKAVAMSVQEDITVLANRPRSALVMGHICTPSFWDPKYVKNASFWSIHQPVPGFPRDERVADRLGAHISSRGPLVRFVWTLCSDDKLDHHPDHPRVPWRDIEKIWYRVERQITIPLNGEGAIFLIRTYVHPLDRLSDEQRYILREAIEVMPQDVADYKGLSEIQREPSLLDLISS